VEILHVFVEPETLDIFGRLQRSCIKLRRKSFKARIRRGNDEFVPERKVWYAFPQAENEKLGKYYPDDPTWRFETFNTRTSAVLEQSEVNGTEFRFLYLGHFTGPGTDPSWVAIAIEKSTDSPALYRRRGFLMGSISRPPDFEQWNGSTSLRTLTLI